MEVETQELEYFVEPAAEIFEQQSVGMASGISILVEDVRRQRSELAQLDSAVRAAKQAIERRTLDERLSRNELLTQLRMLRRDKEDKQIENRALSDRARTAEARVAELEARNFELRSQVERLQTKEADLRATFSKQQLSLEKEAKKKASTDLDAPLLAALEARAAETADRLRIESQRSAKLEKQLTELANEKGVIEKERNLLQAAVGSDRPRQSKSKSDPLVEELRKELRLLEEMEDCYEGYLSMTDEVIEVIQTS